MRAEAKLRRPSTATPRDHQPTDAPKSGPLQPHSRRAHLRRKAAEFRREQQEAEQTV